MTRISKTLHALLVLMLMPAVLRAGLATRTWSETADKDRWRPRILLISEELTDSDTRRLGDALADQAVVYQLQAPSGNAEEALRQIKAGDWELVYIDCKDDAPSIASISTRLHGIAKIAVLRIPRPAPSLAGALEKPGGVFTADYTVVLDQKLDNIIPDYPINKHITGSLAGILRAALLTRSPPWASTSQNTHDLSRLTNQQSILGNPAALPHAKGEADTVYRAKEGEWQFNMHPFIARHDGLFWVIWSCGRVNEDSSSQHLRYATSADGKTWSEAGILAPDPDGEKGRFQWMAGGLHVREGNLYAYGTLHRGAQPDRGLHWKDAEVHQFCWTGSQWRDEGMIMQDSLIYFAPMRVRDEEFAIRRSSDLWIYGARSPFGRNQWKSHELPGYLLRQYRMSETSHYVGNDGVIHLIIRDQAKTKRLYHSVSFDRGGAWTIPVQTNYPDAVSKNLSGRLSNGWFYLVSNPVARRELVMSFSRDGWTFDHAVLLRDNPPALRYKGVAKGSFTFNYPHAVEVDGKFWIVYSVNKEDIEAASFDLVTLCPGE